MANILIENGAILPLNRQGDIHAPGYLLIEGDAIAAVGPGEPPATIRARADRVLDASRKAVIPGLINSHDHLFQTFVRGLSDNRPLMDWLREIVWPVSSAMTAQDMRLAALVGLIENLHGGATAVIDNQYLHTDPGNDDAACQAAAELGIRLRLARGWTDTNAPAFLQDTCDHILAETERVHDAWHGKANGRITVEFGPGVPWGCTEATMRRAYDLAGKWDRGLHMHVAETRVELEMDRQTKGMGHIEWLHSLGELAPTTQLVHAVWLSDREIDLIAESNAVVVHCPASNMYLGSGICQVKRLRERGVRVALGLDGACNNGLGMIDLLKWAANLQQVAHLDAPALPAGDVLRMACLGGAAALGRPDELGSLEVGKKADMVLIDRTSSRLALSNAANLPTALVYTANSADVNTVIVDGEIVLERGKVVGIDEAAVLAEARAAWEAVARRAGVATVI